MTNLKKTSKHYSMKKIIVLISTFLLISNLALAAGDDSGSSSGGASSSGGSGDSKTSLYKEAVSLVKRAGKLEKKEKQDKATKLYTLAFKKLEKAYKTDKKNPDVLNYMGFTSRKTGKFQDAENFYLKGLEIDPKHNGINEYLGELYVQTDRMDKAKERLEVLKNCNCEEYQELELIIKTRGTKIY
tara:strand:- start:179 stop:736 length:558 start_codon:yes stop_codon:yes gene_type:complete